MRSAPLTKADAAPKPGLFRDAANAAWLALMYADLPDASAPRARLARCMALQNVRFILGDNALEVNRTTGYAFQVGFRCARTSVSRSNLYAHLRQSPTQPELLRIYVFVMLPAACWRKIAMLSTGNADTMCCPRADSCRALLLRRSSASMGAPCVQAAVAQESVQQGRGLPAREST